MRVKLLVIWRCFADIDGACEPWWLLAVWLTPCPAMVGARRWSLLGIKMRCVLQLRRSTDTALRLRMKSIRFLKRYFQSCATPCGFWSNRIVGIVEEALGTAGFYGDYAVTAGTVKVRFPEGEKFIRLVEFGK
jgi:hypothetical protein